MSVSCKTRNLLQGVAEITYLICMHKSGFLVFRITWAYLFFWSARNRPVRLRGFRANDELPPMYVTGRLMGTKTAGVDRLCSSPHAVRQGDRPNGSWPVYCPIQPPMMWCWQNLKCGPVPNVMAALPNIGGALCSMSQFGWRPESRYRYSSTKLCDCAKMPIFCLLHSKFALGPHHMWKYGIHPICGRWD